MTASTSDATPKMSARAQRRVRRAERIKAVGLEVEESIIQDAADSKAKYLKNDELFMVDKGNSSTNSATQKLKKKRVHVPTHYEKKAVAAAAARKTKPQKPKKNQKPELLWGDEGGVHFKKKCVKNEFVKVVTETKRAVLDRTTPSTKHLISSVQVADAGQSYHPSFTDHQKSLAVAVTEELEKEKERQELAIPISNGFSKETIDFVNLEAPSTDDESEEDNTCTMNNTSNSNEKSKFTRAQRNKQMRKKKLDASIASSKATKSLVKGINTASIVLKEIKEKEEKDEEALALAASYKAQKLENDPTHILIGGKKTKLEKTTEVNLSTELNGSLRQVIPRGSVMADRFESLLKRNKFQKGGMKPKKKRKQSKMIYT